MCHPTKVIKDVAEGQAMQCADPVDSAISDIRHQMQVNLSYFSGSNRKTLDILQGHIEDSLQRIEKERVPTYIPETARHSE